jgi:hypothetical protein
MGYSSIAEVNNVIANALTGGKIDGGTVIPFEIINIGDLPTDTVSEDIILQHIRWADQTLDGHLSSMYHIPIKRVIIGEYEILVDIATGDTSISIEDSTRFDNGDAIVITDGDSSEKRFIDTIPNETTLELTSAVVNSYLTANGRIQRLRYPDPIPRMSAMYAAANIYDKFFAADQEPNVSDYGTRLRTLFKNDLNGILNGRIRLRGQRQRSRRFFNSALLDTPSVASENKDADEV